MKKMTKSILLLTAGMVLSSCGGLAPASSRAEPSSSAESTQQSVSSSVTSSDESSPSLEPSSSSVESASPEESSSEESSEGSQSEELSSEESPYSEESSSEESSSPEESSISEESSESSIEPIGPAEIFLSWEKVIQNDLKDGDFIVLANESKGLVSSYLGTDKNAGYLASSAALFDENYASLDEGFMAFELKDNGDGTWKFLTDQGYLGAYSTNKLTYADEAEKNWNVSFKDGVFSVSSANSSYGSIYFNPTSGRFTTYTKKGSSYRNVEIYRGFKGVPSYATSIEISGPSSLQIGETGKVSVDFAPSETNIRRVYYSSSDEDVLSVDAKGNLETKGLGKATITAKAYSSESLLDLSDSIEISVLPVPVSGISLSETSKEIAIGGTFDLTATILPANATDKSVTWTSSDESVASVEDGTVTGLSVGTSTITATSVDGNFSATCEVTVLAEILDSWTIMLYVCGSNLESEAVDYSGNVSGLATSDLLELMSVEGQPDDVNILVETGGANKWDKTLGIASDKIGRYIVRDNKLQKEASLSKANMGSASTFKSFLDWGLSEYPAQKTAVIMWDHGGAMYGCCSDENYANDMLTPAEMYSALSDAFEDNDVSGKLEFLGFDCCLMQVADLAEMYSDFFRYMVTSQESEVGTGWDYDNWIDDLYAGDSTDEILTEICDTFIADVEEYLDYWEVIDGEEYDNDQTLSYLDLSKMEAYKDAIEAYAEEKASVIKSNKSTFAKVAKKAKSYADMWLSYQDYYDYTHYYGYSTSEFEKVTEDGVTYYVYRGYQDYGTFDAIDFFDVISGNELFDSEYIPAIKAAIEDAVVYCKIGDGAGNSHGLTLIANIGGTVRNVYTNNCGSRFTNWLDIFSKLF